MKTAFLPPVRVDSKQRARIESVLEEGESLSAFILEAVLTKAEVRRAQAAFVAEGLEAEADAERSKRWVSNETVFGRLEASLKRARRKARQA